MRKPRSITLERRTVAPAAGQHHLGPRGGAEQFERPRCEAPEIARGAAWISLIKQVVWMAWPPCSSTRQALGDGAERVALDMLEHLVRDDEVEARLGLRQVEQARLRIAVALEELGLAQAGDPGEPLRGRDAEGRSCPGAVEGGEAGLGASGPGTTLAMRERFGGRGRHRRSRSRARPQVGMRSRQRGLSGPACFAGGREKKLDGNVTDRPGHCSRWSPRSPSRWSGTARPSPASRVRRRIERLVGGGGGDVRREVARLAPGLGAGGGERRERLGIGGAGGIRDRPSAPCSRRPLRSAAGPELETPRAVRSASMR